MFFCDFLLHFSLYLGKGTTYRVSATNALTMFSKFIEQNYFLFSYKKTFHNIFYYIVLYQLNTLSLFFFCFPTFCHFYHYIIHWVAL
jgi:hypothetical protein